MKLRYIILFVASCVATLSLRAEADNRVNWDAFLAKHDLVWTTLPKVYEESAFVGNGLLGATIYQGPEQNTLRFNLGRSDVVFKKNRIMIGEFRLKPTSKITEFSMRQKLWDAEVVGSIKTAGGAIQFTAFTSAQYQVQVIILESSGTETALAFPWTPGPATSWKYFDKLYTIRPDAPAAERNPDPVASTENGITLSSQPLTAGGGHVTAWKEINLDAGKRLILTAIGYSTTDLEAAKQEALNTVNRAAAAGLAKLVAEHRQWWHAYYPQSFVSIPDARLESFYWIQMYKMASATRADRPIIDLMGPWSRPNGWAMMWWNLNVQLCYWPMLISNRLELGESLYRTLDEKKANMIDASQDTAWLGRCSSYDLVSNSGELSNLTWVLHNYYLHYRYTMDEAMLRDRIFPLLKQSVNKTRLSLVSGPDGKLHIKSGVSPEYENKPNPNPDCNYDLTLLRWGCETLLATNDRLKLNDPLVPEWQKILRDLTPYPTDENGFKVSAQVSFAESHRHYSHLFMIYPLYTMNLETQPEAREVALKSINHWLGMRTKWTAFSMTGAASFYALMGNGEEAARSLNLLLDNNWGTKMGARMGPNTMYMEVGNACMESPLSVPASLHDMLLSSWGDRIRVFPAVPTTWADVSFYHLRTEGAFLVSAVRKGGATQWIEIKSLAGAPCRIWTDLANPVADGKTLKPSGPGVYDLELAKGETVLIYPKGQKPVTTVDAVTTTQGIPNFFGTPKTPAAKP